MTNARRWLLPCLVLLLCLSATLARAASPMARVHVLGEQPALVNQQVRIEVEILTPNYFTSAPPFPDIQIPGAIVTMPDETGQNSVEQLDGQTYAGILKTYVFTAQQPGDFTLPSLAVKFSYGGDDGKSRPGEVTLPPTHISVRAAEGATMAGGVQAPVARLSITQSFDRPVDGKDAHLEAGDALVRTLDTFAEMTQAMMIPPPKIEAHVGMSRGVHCRSETRRCHQGPRRPRRRTPDRPGDLRLRKAGHLQAPRDRHCLVRREYEQAGKGRSPRRHDRGCRTAPRRRHRARGRGGADSGGEVDGLLAPCRVAAMDLRRVRARGPCLRSKLARIASSRMEALVAAAPGSQGGERAGAVRSRCRCMPQERSRGDLCGVDDVVAPACRLRRIGLERAHGRRGARAKPWRTRGPVVRSRGAGGRLAVAIRSASRVQCSACARSR